MKAVKKFVAWLFAPNLNALDLLVMLLIFQPLGLALSDVFGIWIAAPMVVSIALLWAFLSSLGEYLTKGWHE